jgi:cysteine synthase
MNSRHPALDNLARRSIPGQKETTTPNHQRVYGSIVELIANPANPTPMVKLSESYNASPDFEMLLKLESFNPFGSIKDRTALYLLKGTQLAENQVLAEPTAGNTGIALAALANAQGTDIELAVPEATPEEKKTLLRLLGAELLEVEDELCPLFPTEGARGVVKSMVESAAFNGKYVSPNQYENELNVDAHYNTTGPEIWNQTGGDIDYFLKISDLPKEFRPKILDYSLIDDIIGVDDRDAFEAGIQLARSEGIMVGPTTGAVLHAARQLSKTAAGRAVVISPDGATKYVSAYAEYLEDD